MSDLVVTGFLNLDSMNWVDCPTCLLTAGRNCIHAGRRPSKGCHPERITAYQAAYPDRVKLYNTKDWRITRSAVEEYNRKLRDRNTGK